MNKNEIMKAIGPILVKAIHNAKDEVLKHFFTIGISDLWKAPNSLEAIDAFAKALINNIQKEYIPPFTPTENQPCDSKND